jgi:hypothetical protein
MDRSLTRNLVRQAESSVLEADLLVARQRKLVRELHLHGADTSDAAAHLDELQRVQARCLFNRDRLLAELDDSDSRT